MCPPLEEPGAERAPGRPAASSDVVVTVVVPARNEEATLTACLDGILAQQGVDLEVVVVDNGSTDGTRALLARREAADPRIRVLDEPLPSIPRSLNAALGVARGRWLVRVDAHSTISPGYVARAVSRLESGVAVGIGGRKTAVGTSSTGKAIAAVLNSRLAVGGSVYHYGTVEQVVDHVPFGCYPVDLVRSLGGWDESVSDNEDFEFDQRLRAHGDLLFDPALQIDWNCRETLPALFRQYRRYGRGKPGVAARHPGSVSPRHLAPPALVVVLACSMGLLPLRPRWAALGLMPYVLAILAAAVPIARAAAPGAARPAVPAALVTMQVSWGLGFWEGLAVLLRRSGDR